MHLKFMNSQLKLSSLVDMTSGVEMINNFENKSFISINLNTSISFYLFHLYKVAEK